MKHPDKIPEVAIMLNNLVRNPFTLLNSLGSSAEGHEISLDDVLGILGIEPEGERSRQVISRDEVVAGHGTTGFIHADGLGERRRVGQRRNFRGQARRGLTPLR